MSLIPFNIHPRSLFDSGDWLHPTLDVFDPFDEIDRTMSRNLNWVNWPPFFEPQQRTPKVPRKYRVTVDCAGYSPSSLQTEIKEGKLYVHGKEESKESDEDFSTKEFRKTYKLPKNAEPEKMVSFVTPLSQMVIEVPLKSMTEETEEDMSPKIVDLPEGGKQMTVKCSIPKDVNPEKLTVTCKNRDIIVKGEDIEAAEDTASRKHYYKRYTLPENTNFNDLKCRLENNNLIIQAPITEKQTFQKQYPIEFKK